MASSSPVSSSLKASLSAAASAAAAIMVARSVAQDFLPDEFHDYLTFYIRKFLSQFSSQLTMVVNEFDDRLVPNQIYDAAETYLASRINPSTKRLNVSQPDKENTIQIRMERHEEVTDEFEGVKFNWILRSKKIQSPPRRRLGSSRDDDDDLLMLSHAKFFEVSFPKQHQEMAVKSYFPHIVREARAMKQEKRTLKIFTVEPENLYGDISEVWTGVNLDHPATFDTLALDTELKNNILTDLERFVKRKDYYKRVGKAWKRGYLLYGPPGTGKSSLIAAMANYLNFDVYDLELTELRENSELRKLIIATANQSILVVEDIDCTVDFQDRSAAADNSNSNSGQRRHVTLSGLLNFIDGLWSSCGDERIIVFTTNHKEKLDSALLRPGRMDMHINLSYCTPCGFRILAENYLGVKDHELFDEIEGRISEAEVTPAEVAEQLMRNDDDDGDSVGVLARLIEFLKLKKKDEEKGEVERKSGEKQEIGDSGSSSGSDDED